MCPACLATVALVVAGATSAGGLTALVVTALAPNAGAKTMGPAGRTGGEGDEPSRDRIA